MSDEPLNIETWRRVQRMIEHTRYLRMQTPEEIRTQYAKIERIRDDLNRILDRADDKDA